MIGSGNYDENQMRAELLACGTCGRRYYTTVPAPAWVCLVCRRAAARRLDVGPLENRGRDAVLANDQSERGSVLATHAPAVPTGEEEEIDTFAQWYLGDLDVDNPQAG